MRSQQFVDRDDAQFSVKCEHYVGTRDDADNVHNARVYQQWMSGEVQVVVATAAFAMGVDKANVRWTLHFLPPLNLESLIQECGRAGRDGIESRCVVLFNEVDREKQEKNFRSLRFNHEQKQQHDAVHSYCNNKDECRHLQISKHFGDSSATSLLSQQSCSNMCDVCSASGIRPPTQKGRKKKGGPPLSEGSQRRRGRGKERSVQTTVS